MIIVDGDFGQGADDIQLRLEGIRRGKPLFIPI